MSLVEVPDRSFSLETKSPEVEAWVAAQQRKADDYFTRHGGVERVAASVRAAMVPPSGPSPIPIPQGWVSSRQLAGSAQLVLADAPGEPGRVLFDLAAETGDSGDQSIHSVHPSPDGTTIAVYARTGQALQLWLVTVDGAEAVLVEDALTWGPVAWLPSSGGLFYTAVGPGFVTRIALHGIADERTHREIPAVPGPDPLFGCHLSPDGQLLVAAAGSLFDPAACFVLDLGDPDGSWQELPALGDGTVSGRHYVAIDTVGASRGRLVRVDLDGARQVQELVPESSALLQQVEAVGSHLVVAALVDGSGRIRIFDGDGRLVDEVPLPELGTVGRHGFPGIVPTSESSFIFSFTSPVASSGTWSYDLGRRELTPLIPPAVGCDDLVVRRLAVTSDDGTELSVYLTHQRALDLTQPHPTLIHSYGGYNGALTPAYHAPVVAFARAGGVFALALIRGGGEYGRDGWAAARGRHKQRTFDDLYAVVDQLVDFGVSDSRRVAFVGGSAGGLVAAAAYCQRPTMFKAVVALVPLVDVRRQLEVFPVGHAIAEFGDLNDPEEARAVEAYSPLSSLRAGDRHPALFIGVGEEDAACPPWHGYLLALRAEAADISEAPVVLRTWPGGHEVGPLAFEHRAEWTAEWLSFVARELEVAL